MGFYLYILFQIAQIYYSLSIIIFLELHYPTAFYQTYTPFSLEGIKYPRYLSTAGIYIYT
jgi:hypothetical protein